MERNAKIERRVGGAVEADFPLGMQREMGGRQPQRDRAPGSIVVESDFAPNRLGSFQTVEVTLEAELLLIVVRPYKVKVLAGGEDPRPALQRLRRSVVAETLIGTLLIAVVAVMGTLAPPSAM